MRSDAVDTDISASCDTLSPSSSLRLARRHYLFLRIVTPGSIFRHYMLIESHTLATLRFITAASGAILRYVLFLLCRLFIYSPFSLGGFSRFTNIFYCLLSHECHCCLHFAGLLLLRHAGAFGA